MSVITAFPVLARILADCGMTCDDFGRDGFDQCRRGRRDGLVSVGVRRRRGSGATPRGAVGAASLTAGYIAFMFLGGAAAW